MWRFFGGIGDYFFCAPLELEMGRYNIHRALPCAIYLASWGLKDLQEIAASWESTP